MVSVAIHCVAAFFGRRNRRSNLSRLVHVGIYHGVLRLGIRAMQPTVLELRSIEINGPHVCISIVSARKYAAGIRILTTQISHGCQIALATVAVVAFIALSAAVIPVESTCCLTQFGFCIAVGIIGNGMDGCTRQSVEDRQIFMSAVDTASTHPPVFRVAGSLDTIIRSSLVYVVPFTVLTAWSSLADQFCLTILVEVIHQELRVVGTCTDVVAQVNTPELRSIQFIAVDIHASGVSTADGIVL